MIITYQDIMALGQVTDKISALKLPMKDSIKIAMLLRTASKHAEVFNAERTKIVERYSLEGPDREEQIEQANKEIYDALTMEIELDFEPIDISQATDTLDIETALLTLWMWKTP